MHGPARATAMYVKQFPKLSESTVRGWVAKYRKELSGTENNQFTINDSNRSNCNRTKAWNTIITANRIGCKA